MKMKSAAAILLALLALTGCASVSHFGVSVSSLAAPEASAAGKSYFLASGQKGVTEADLQFREYASYVERALSFHGYTRVATADSASLMVLIGYGIGDPKTIQSTFAFPTFGQTGVSGSQTYGTGHSYGGMTSYSATTVNTPTYGVTGYVPITETDTYFSRWVFLDCYDLAAYRSDGKEVQIWKTTIGSEGSSGDLRRVFPVMIAAARPFIGTNTAKQVHVKLRESNRVIAEIKGDLKR